MKTVHYIQSNLMFNQNFLILVSISKNKSWASLFLETKVMQLT